MNNNAALLRTLAIYTVCVPLAIVLGLLATSAGSMSSRTPWIEVGLLLLLLCAPLLLRWHHILLILCWNLPIIVFFLPASPPIYLPMLLVSLGISVLQRAVNSNLRFIPAPQITWPLLCLAAVVLGTAKLTGGIGFTSLGSESGGGRKYAFLLAGILGFFALTARRIPHDKAYLYVALFYLSGCLAVMGNVIPFLPHQFNTLYLFFPGDFYTYQNTSGNLRFGGAVTMTMAIIPYMLARYGFGGIFRAHKPWRAAAFIFFTAMVFFGGFRGQLFNLAILFSILFFLEGLHRTRLLPLLAFAGIIGAILVLPMADRMPFAVQRTLSFLPAEIVNIDPFVRQDAEGSLDWHIQMWQGVLPQVPSHLLLGKGYAISKEDFQMLGYNVAFKANDPGQQGLALAGDYHNGPLSVILPFGIWGAMAFLWLLFAGVWVVHHNYHYGDPALLTINRLLFAAFVGKIIYFLIIFGALSNDISIFAGLLGLSISLNGGICRPVREAPVAAAAESRPRLPARPRLQPVFPR